MDRKKMSPHSRAALDAADTMRRVIDQMTDAPFMSEKTSDRTAARHDRAETAREMVGDAPQYVLERIAREMEHDNGL